MTLPDFSADGATTLTTAAALVRDNLKDYQIDVILNKFPHPIDGLRTGQRRAILVASQQSGYIKSGSMVSAANDLHHQNPDALYDAMVRMAQPWQFNPPLFDLDGDMGSYTGDRPGADRYTRLLLSDFGKALFFRGIDVFALPKKRTKDLDGREVQNFVPALPAALLLPNGDIGFGFQCLPMLLHLNAVCELVEAEAERQQKTPHLPFPAATHAERLVPEFPLPNIITNHDQLITGYRHGLYTESVHLDGHAALFKDRILIYTLPYMVPFKQAVDLLSERVNEKNSWWDQTIAHADLSKDAAKVSCVEVLLKKNPKIDVFEVWERVQKLVKFSATVTPLPNYATDDGQVRKRTPVNLLQLWYQRRVDTVMATKRYRIQNLARDLSQIEALQAIEGHTDEAIAIIKSNTEANAVPLLANRFSISVYQATYLINARLKTLTTDAPDKLRLDHEKTLTSLNQLKASFNTIHEEIAGTARAMKKEFGRPRLTRIPNYIGYVGVGSGCVQIENVSEIEGLLERFPRTPVRIHLYDGPHLMRVTGDGKLSRDVMHKHTTGDLYGLRFAGERGYTVIIKDGAACAVKGIVPGSRADGYFYVPKRAIAIERHGAVRVIDVPSDISMRKQPGRGANTEIVYLYPHNEQPHYVVTCTDEQPNILTVQRVDLQRGRIITPGSARGQLWITHSHSGRDWYLTVPETCLNRINARAFCIVDADRLLGEERTLRIDVAQNKYKRHSLFKVLE